MSINLAGYNHIFGEDTLINTLKQLPKPDIIIASPPCESWSTASGILGGNRHWHHQDGFKIRSKTEVEHTTSNFKFVFNKSIYVRINGELCINNIIRIINEFKPVYWVIENPLGGAIWKYIENIIEFEIPFKNKAHYSAYNDSFSKKPTCFASNIQLNLKTTKQKAKVLLVNKTKESKDKTKDNRKAIFGYNKRSNIPLELIRDIFNQFVFLY